jgi:glycerophosphoryl diester phosphodiesterase
MERAGSRVFAVAPCDGLEFSRGLDDAQDLAALPPGYSGGIWTDRIDRVGRLVKGGAPPSAGP